MNEIRTNPLTGKRIIFSPDRMKRPQDFNFSSKKISNKNCPFCPGNEGKTPKELFRLGGKKWKTRVIYNAFPIVKPEGKAFGYHEIVIESPDHFSNFTNKSHVKNTFKTYYQRYMELSRMKKIKHISIFKNYGKEAGASLTHPHSQIMAISFMPKEMAIEIKNTRKMKKILDDETNSKRLIFEDKNVVVFTPYFSEVAYEVWILPKKKARNILHADIDSLATAVNKIIKKMKKVLGDFSYNMILKQSIKKDYHMRIMIRPRLEIPAGFEIDTGVSVNTALPEKVAEYLR